MTPHPIHYIDVPCTDCGADIGKPCKRAMYPHDARRIERQRQREAQDMAEYDAYLAEQERQHNEQLDAEQVAK